LGHAANRLLSESTLILCTLRDAELRRRNSLAQQKRGGQSENVPEEAEAAEESSRVLAHARASFFHDLHIRSQRAFQNGFVPPGNRMVPDIAWLADPFTGVEIIQTIGGSPTVEVIGGTSLATPMFSALMAIAAQKNGHVGLGQAASLVYGLGGGAIADIVPKDGSPNNVTGSVTGNVNTSFSADFLAGPLGNTTTYYSALYNSPFSTRWFVITFGTDTSLTTGPGWDNVTGVGTPNGLAFINAIAP
jgi:subtilase family serine protease